MARVAEKDRSGQRRKTKAKHENKTRMGKGTAETKGDTNCQSKCCFLYHQRGNLLVYRKKNWKKNVSNKSSARKSSWTS